MYIPIYTIDIPKARNNDDEVYKVENYKGVGLYQVKRVKNFTYYDIVIVLNKKVIYITDYKTFLTLFKPKTGKYIANIEIKLLDYETNKQEEILKSMTLLNKTFNEEALGSVKIIEESVLKLRKESTKNKKEFVKEMTQQKNELTDVNYKFILEIIKAVNNK